MFWKAQRHALIAPPEREKSANYLCVMAASKLLGQLGLLCCSGKSLSSCVWHKAGVGRILTDQTQTRLQKPKLLWCSADNCFQYLNLRGCTDKKSWNTTSLFVCNNQSGHTLGAAWGGCTKRNHKQRCNETGLQLNFEGNNYTYLINHYEQKFHKGLTYPDLSELIVCGASAAPCGITQHVTALCYLLYVSLTFSSIYYVWEGKRGPWEDYKSLTFWWD